MTNISDKVDFKYNSILKCNLFVGVINFEDFVNYNDELLTNVINNFESIKPEGDSKTHKTSEKLMLNSIVKGDDKNIKILLSIFQKNISKEVEWVILVESRLIV